jgi:hypothetical protein
MAAGAGEGCRDGGCGNASSLVKLLKRAIQTLIKECFDAIVHHFEIPGKKHNPSRIAVPEKYFLSDFEHHLNPNQSFRNIKG